MSEVSSCESEGSDDMRPLDDNKASLKTEAYVHQGRLSQSLYYSLLNVVTVAIPALAEIRHMQAKRGEISSGELANTCPACLQSVDCFYRHMWWECDLTRASRHQAAFPGHILPCPVQIHDP